MSAVANLFLFILGVILLGVVWVFTGGPDRAISHSGPFLQPPAPLGSGNAYTVPLVDLSVPQVGTSEGSSSGSGSSANQDDEDSGSLLDYFNRFRRGIGVVQDVQSPYAEFVSLEVGRAKNSDPKTEYVIIRTSAKQKQSITITGWKIESNASGIVGTIGQAAVIPFLGQVNVETPITVGPKATIYLGTGQSPNGTSFRTNICTGYFEQFQDFSPSLKKDCPLPEDEMLRFPEKLAGNDLCINFIEDLNRCELRVNAIPGNVGGLCQDFILNELSYNGCINSHKNDPDFYKNEWRIFFNRDQELYKNTREYIRLLDENGKLIDSVSY